MSIPAILVRSPDRYVITEAEIKADTSANQGLADTATARRARSDEVSSKLVGLYSGREPWRNTYSEVLSELDNDGKHIRLSRYPIEEVPEIWLGAAPIERGFYRLAGCPHFLVRNDHWRRRGHCWSVNGHRYSVPSYVAGYVPPGSINGAWEPETDYAPGHSTALGNPKGSWVRSSNPAGQLLFENTSPGTSATPGNEPDWPLSLAAWAPRFEYSNRWVNPISSEFVFEPTTPGTSDPEEEPVWTDAENAGDTVADGDIVWTARVDMSIPDATTTWTGRNARPFPEIIRLAALLMARLVAKLRNDGDCDSEAEMKNIISLLQGEC